MTSFKPEKLKLSSGISPIKMSQTANSSIPILLVSFIGESPLG
jgi:hypothetical protein